MKPRSGKIVSNRVADAVRVLAASGRAIPGGTITQDELDATMRRLEDGYMYKPDPKTGLPKIVEPGVLKEALYTFTVSEYAKWRNLSRSGAQGHLDDQVRQGRLGYADAWALFGATVKVGEDPTKGARMGKVRMRVRGIWQNVYYVVRETSA